MVQNRSSVHRRVQLAPIALPSDFPIRGGGHRFDDRTLPDLHLHDILEIGICHRGDGLFVVEDKVFSFQAGDVVIIGPTEAHRAYSPRGVTCECSFYYVDIPGLLGGLLTQSPLLDSASWTGKRFPNRFRAADAPELSSCVARLFRECEEKKPFYRDSVRGLLIEILVGVARRIPEAAVSERPRRSYAAMVRIRPALEAVAHEYARELAVPELARRCSMSTPHFRRLFTALLGRSPLDYLHEYRIALAAYQLRHTHDPVGQIAWSVGYASLSSFHRQFQMRIHCSPLDWREDRRNHVRQLAASGSGR